MVDLAPGTALLAALQNQFNAARQGQGRGTNALIPGLPAGAGGEDTGGSVLGGGGISAGGVPGTATTGQSVANSLIGGGGAGSDPLAQQVSGALRGILSGRQPGEQPERPNVPGGDAEMLMSLITGGPLALVALLAQSVGGGVAADPFGDSFATSLEQGREFGGNIGGPAIGGQIGQGLGSVNSIRSGGFGNNEGSGSPGVGNSGGNSRQFDSPEFGA